MVFDGSEKESFYCSEFNIGYKHLETSQNILVWMCKIIILSEHADNKAIS